MGQIDPPTQGAGKRTPRTGQPSGRLDVLARRGVVPRICRLFHRWGERPVEWAAETLRQAFPLMDGGLLVAGAGFAWVRLPSPTRQRFPDEDEFAAVTNTARQAAEVVRASLPANRSLVVFGLDVYALCARSDAERAVSQFAVVLRPGGEPPQLLPKRFPTPTETAYLPVPEVERAADLTCDTPLGRAAVLVCHDVNVYSPRGEATTSYEERAAWRTAVRDGVRSLAPALGLHLAHYLETATSFRQAYNAWAAEVGAPLVGVSGLPLDISAEDAASLADSLLGGADDLSVLDLLERPTE